MAGHEVLVRASVVATDQWAGHHSDNASHLYQQLWYTNST